MPQHLAPAWDDFKSENTDELLNIRLSPTNISLTDVPTILESNLAENCLQDSEVGDVLPFQVLEPSACISAIIVSNLHLGYYRFESG